VRQPTPAACSSTSATNLDQCPLRLIVAVVRAATRRLLHQLASEQRTLATCRRARRAPSSHEHRRRLGPLDVSQHRHPTRLRLGPLDGQVVRQDPVNAPSGRGRAGSCWRAPEAKVVVLPAPRPVHVAEAVQLLVLVHGQRDHAANQVLVPEPARGSSAP